MANDPARQAMAAQPQLSPDGRWWWDGQRWQPVPATPAAPSPPSSALPAESAPYGGWTDPRQAPETADADNPTPPDAQQVARSWVEPAPAWPSAAAPDLAAPPHPAATGPASDPAETAWTLPSEPAAPPSSSPSPALTGPLSPLSPLAPGAGEPAPAAAPIPAGLDASTFLKSKAPAPAGGIRRVLYRATGGAVNLGAGSRELRHAELLEAARTPVIEPPERIAFASAKGGVGKSTATLLTTSQLGLLRHDRILAVECNPHHGTFRSRVKNYHDRSVRDLIEALNQLDRDEDLTYPMLHRYTTLIDDARLETLTAPHDPTISQALGEEDYRRVFNVLYRYYDLISLDLGTGLLDSGTHYILSRVCDQVVVVVESAVDGADLGIHTLKFITARRGAEWVRERAIVVINQVRKDSLVDVRQMEQTFGQIARRCLTVRWDRQLEAGGVFVWDDIGSATREDFLALAAELAGGFRLGAAPDTDRPGHAPR
ncbi:MAG: hypothetical protein ACREQM_12560 [Candidatus Dormibacteraceae bacterium]